MLGRYKKTQIEKPVCIFAEIEWCNTFKEMCNHECPRSKYQLDRRG